MEITTTQQQLFDYEALELIHRQPILRATEEIRHFTKVAATACIRIGERLADVHHRMPSVDVYEKWLKAEFGWSLTSSYNFTRVYQQFGTAESVDNIAPSALYLLAAPSTPAEARVAALQLAADGNQVTHQLAKTIVQQTKQTAAEAQASLLPVPEEDDIPVCLCGHKADRHADVSCDDCTCEQWDEAPAGQDDVSIYRQITDDTATVLPTEACFCGHHPADHEEFTNCKFCNCECYQTERADHSNVETLVEQTTTTKTVEVLPPVKMASPTNDIAGEAEILWDAARIVVEIVIEPKKGNDRVCGLTVYEMHGAPIHSVCQYSQIADALTSNITLQRQLLALKADIFADAEKEKYERKAAAHTESIARLETKKKKTVGQGTPTNTVRDQSVLQEMGKCYAARNLSENKPVKLYYLDGNPYLVTGMVSYGSEYNSVTAWDVLPESIAGDRPVGQVNHKSGYLNVRFKVGKAPWVVVGPKHTFTPTPPEKKKKGKAALELPDGYTISLTQDKYHALHRASEWRGDGFEEKDDAVKQAIYHAQESRWKGGK